MAAKKVQPMDFIVATLKRRPKITYADLLAAAKKKRLKVYPIMYGRAKALLGLVKSKPRGSKKKAAKRKARGPGRPRRGPGRPRKSSGAADSLESLIQSVKEVQRDRDQMRRTLERVQALIQEAL